MVRNRTSGVRAKLSGEIFPAIEPFEMEGIGNEQPAVIAVARTYARD